MSAAASRSEPPHQRAHGRLELTLARDGAVTRLKDLRQEGCLKLRFPHRHGAARAEAVMLNIAGGVAAGDDLATRVELGEGAEALLSSQAAERFYRALPGAAPARVETTLSLAEGADLEWLPQESIVFDGAALTRSLRIEMAATSRFLGVESLVFGRTAMGERVARARLDDRIVLYRAGDLLLHEALRFDGEVAARLARPAVASGAVAMATLLMVAPEVADWLDPLRAALAPYEAGASAWNGLLLARILAADGAALRAAVEAALAVLRPGRELPRVWMC